MKKIFYAAMALFIGVCAWAQAPTGYYSSCEGKSGQTLLTALFNTIGDHTVVSYSELWDVYKTSDIKPNGKIWDMYSTKEWTPGADQCGSYSSVGDCYNREHSMPKSWFNDASPMYSDAYHIYPTDGKVNGQRSNHPFGECANGTTLSPSNGVQALGRLGTSTFAGYSGTVFEPVDEYKGDFARTYFYMATCYNDRISSWNSDMLAGNNYPCYKTWAVNLLLKWHRQDPVSQKEIDRNNAVYGYQKNRNPYIDYPELAEHVWGDKTAIAWNSSSEPAQEINTPVNGSTIDMGVTAVNVTRSATITVKGSAMKEAVAVSVSGTGFSTSATTLSAASVNSESGAILTINYKSSSAATSTGKLTLTSGDCSVVVNLTAKAMHGLPAEAATNITETSFTANWVNVNTDDATMKYSINVYKDGAMIAGYPVQVLASLENYNVTRLEPATAYTYTISSPTLTSNTMSVTTATPVPMIQLVYDAELAFATAPGTPSDAVEIELYSEYIEENITISVKVPFEVSSDKATWSQTISLDPLEDRFYMRLNPATEGTYTTLVNAVAGDCSAESLEATGLATTGATFIEDFEQDATGMSSYSPTENYNGTASVWHFSNAGIWSTDDARDTQSVRFGKNTDSYIEMVKDKTSGAGNVSFYAQLFGSDAAAKINVQYSTDQGATWITAGTVSITETTFTEHIVAVNVAGNIRFRFQQTEGKRLNIDDIAITNHVASVIDNEIASSWDAYCRDRLLIVEGSMDIPVKVYSVDGILRHSQQQISGTSAIELPKGLYIIVVGDTSRRVLIK